MRVFIIERNEEMDAYDAVTNESGSESAPNPRIEACFLHPRRCVNRQIALVVSPRRECVPSGTTIRLPGPMTSGHGGIAAEIRVVRVRSEGQSRIRPTKLRRGLRLAAAPRVSASDPRLPPKGI